MVKEISEFSQETDAEFNFGRIQRLGTVAPGIIDFTPQHFTLHYTQFVNLNFRLL